MKYNKQDFPKTQTKDDEIAFLTNMYEEKVKALMSIDLGSDAFASAFSNELALALRDIRGEYEAIMEATRSQVRRLQFLQLNMVVACSALLTLLARSAALTRSLPSSWERCLCL